MAFVSNSGLPQNEQNQNAPQGQTTPNPMSLMLPQTGGSSGQGGGGGAGGTQANSPTVGSPTQFGSSASKLSDYLSANAPQIQGMANNIAWNLNNQYGQITGDINTAGTNFANSVNSGYAAPNQDLVYQAASNPEQFVQNPGNVSAFQQQLNDQYTGPQSFETTTPYSNIQNEVQSAVQNTGVLNSPGGLSQYLRNNVENNPTQGQNTLDTVLLESSPSAVGAVNTAAQPFSGLTDYLGNVTAQGDALVSPAQQAAQNASSYARNAFLGPTGVASVFGPTLNQKMTNQQNDQMGTVNQIRDLLASGQNLNDAQLNNIGLTRDQYNALIDRQGALAQKKNAPAFNLSSYLNPSSGFSLEQVATPNDFSRQAALEQLLGNQYQGPLNESLYSQAGTIPSNAGVYDRATAQEELDKDLALSNS